MKNTLITILVIVILVLGYLFIKEKTKPVDSTNVWPETEPATPMNNNSQTNTSPNSNTSTPVGGLKLFTRAVYSFRAPSSWKETGPSDIGGCAWDGVANDTSDGLRQAGEIGIYPKSCFNLANADYAQMTERDGFYILAYYSRDNGTTAAEERETKAVYQSIVNSFEVLSGGNPITKTYSGNGFKIDYPKDMTVHEEDAEGGPYRMIYFSRGSISISYVKDAAWFERYDLADLVFVGSQLINSNVFKTYNANEGSLLWLRTGDTGYALNLSGFGDGDGLPGINIATFDLLPKNGEQDATNWNFSQNSGFFYPANWTITSGENTGGLTAFSMTNGNAVISWGGPQSACSENQQHRSFQYGVSVVACINTLKTNIGVQNVRNSLTQEELNIFGDFVFYNPL